MTEENQAVALVHGARPVPDEALEAAALKLLEKLRRLTRREVFFTVGPPAQGPRQLAASVQEAEERSEYKFFADAGMVVFSKEGYLAAADLNTVVDGLTRSLMEDIHYAAFEKMCIRDRGHGAKIRLRQQPAAAAHGERGAWEAPGGHRMLQQGTCLLYTSRCV